MSGNHLILCERTGIWAVVLRHCLRGRSIAVSDTPSRETFWQRMIEAPSAVAAIEAYPDATDWIVDSLIRLATDFPRAIGLVLCPENTTAPAHPLFYEAGAVLVVEGMHRVQEALPAIERHFGRLQENNFLLRFSLQQKLPWDAAG